VSEGKWAGVTVGMARWCATKSDSERAVVISASKDGQPCITSYGETMAVCRRLGNMIKAGDLDDIAAAIRDA
jgi:hypothetical protein